MSSCAQLVADTNDPTCGAQLAISAWLVSRFNLRHDYLSLAVRDRTRFILFACCWTFFFGVLYFGLFLYRPTGGVFTSVLSHAVL